MDQLNDILGRLNGMPEEHREEIIEKATAFTMGRKWISNPGPQTEAYYCEADVLLYGGEAAGGKTDLLGGLGLTAHKRSLIMRRQYTDLGALIERIREIDGTYAGFNGSPPPRLRTEDGRLIDFGAAAKLGDEKHWMGQPHDFLGIDEVVHFLEAQVRLLMGWVRSADLGQRVRTVFATNPPLSAQGDFIIGMFRPWLDITHHNPAKQGELRHYVTDPDGKDFEVDGPEPYEFPGQDRPVIPHTRTFIRASLSDNPYLVDSGYAAVLDALPEPLRSAVRDGNFMLGRDDDKWQLIPTAWIQAAQARWKEHPPAGIPMSSMAVDPSAGGKDKTTLAWRHDSWFAPIIEIPGVETPLGKEVAGLVIMNRTDNAVVIIDMGGGYGGVPYTTLEDNGVEPYAHKGSEGSNARTKDRKLGFYNYRSEVHWKFREALDPSQPGGSHIQLPPDQELLSDLTSIRWKPVQHKGVMCIKAETKEDVVANLGRSPDKGDVVIICWSKGEATALGQIIQKDQRMGVLTPKVITSRMHKR